MELLKIDDPQERSFYLQECEQENWGVRELKRQMKSMLFQRLVLSKNKGEVIMGKKDLREQSGISTTSLAKLGKGENITTDVLLKICEALNCNINEIMESESEPGDEKKVLDTDPVDVKQKSDTESVKR